MILLFAHVGIFLPLVHVIGPITSTKKEGCYRKGHKGGTVEKDHRMRTCWVCIRRLLVIIGKKRGPAIASI